MSGKRDPKSHRTPEQIKQHYRDYQGTPEQIRNRAMRNKARAEVKSKVGAAAIAGKDVDHKRPLIKGGGNSAANLRIQSPKTNRGWERKKGAGP